MRKERKTAMLHGDLEINSSNPSGYFMCHQVLTLTNSTLCPQSVFMCFVRILEQTGIISVQIN